jgi:Protein of unknown function (DUF3237)
MRAALLMALASAMCPIAEGKNDMNQSERIVTTVAEAAGIELLFKGDLQHRSESQVDAVTAGEEHEGAYIGSGDGTVTGERLRGKIRWSLWAGNCLYPLVRSGQAVPEGLHLCTMNPTGVIETQDGARIRFHGRGYGLRTPNQYKTSLTLVFGTEDPRYTWLTKTLAVTDGDFNEKAGRAVWNVYVPTTSH